MVSKGLNGIEVAIKKDKSKPVVKSKTSEKQKTTPKPKVADEHYCYRCNKFGNWQSSCPKYMKD